MILDTGRIVKFDRPATLLADPNSRFYQVCKATGKGEFSTLQKMAGAITPIYLVFISCQIYQGY